MSRRAATLALTGVSLVALVAAAWLLPVPYVAMSPGPARDVLGEVDGSPVIEISGHKEYDTPGELDLTTVSATPADSRLELLGALAAWVDPDVAVVPRNYLYPEDETPEQVEQRNAEQMDTSQQDAVAAALRRLESDGEVDASLVAVPGVISILEGSPSQDKLRAGDVILAVDGEKTPKVSSVVDAVSSHEPGSEVEVRVRRGDEKLDVSITTTAREDDPDKAAIGIQVGELYEYDGEVDFHLGAQIGGPSAGLVFALGIYDKLTADPLIDGRHVAGTGTIDSEGAVGAIGGIQQKVRGAKKAGASVFLVPAANCETAVAAEIEGIDLFRIETFDDAVEALGSVDAGKASEVPRC